MAGNFDYDANKPAAILFAILFGIALILHLFQAYRTRVLFMSPLIFATLLQVYGYAVRYIAIVNDDQEWPIITSQTAIVVAPAFLAAQDYMIIGRMIAYVGEESTFLSHTVITKLFVGLDILCVVTQSGGAALLFGNKNSRSAVMSGRTVLIGGLLAQCLAFMIFVVIAILFDRKAQLLKGSELRRLRPLFIAFYVTAFLIIGRSLYRTIEFAMINFDFSKPQGYLFSHEWPFYVLDSVPIFISTILFNAIYPANYLPAKKGLRMDGTIEPPRKHWWSKAPAKIENTSEVPLTSA